MADPRMLSDEDYGALLPVLERATRSDGKVALYKVTGYIAALTEQLATDEDLLRQCLVRLEYDGAMGSVYRAVRARLEGEEDDG